MSTRAFAGAAALLLTSAPLAWADLTADQLWADWQATYGEFGIQISAGEESSGDTLTLNDLTVSMTNSGVSNEAVYGTIRLTNQADGTVRIDIPAEMNVSSVVEFEDERIEQSFVLTNEGLEMIAAQDGDIRSYVVAADSFGYRFDDVTSGESPDPIPLIAVMNGLNTTYSVDRGGETLGLTQEFAADELIIEADGAATESPFTVRYVAQELFGTGAGSFDGATMSALADAPGLADLGVDFEATFTHSGSDTTMTITTADGPVDLNSTSAGGEIFLELTPDGLTETFSSTDTNATVVVPQFPVPLTAAMDAFTAGFTVPVGVSEDPKSFALDLVLENLAIDDAIWSLFDPTGQLPRDPATVRLDLDGEALMTADIFGNPDAFASGPPGELQSLTLGDLTLSLAGADLNASGDLDFPSPDISRPVGTIQLAVDGAFMLIDRLVALGFLPPEQAGFAKGMATVVAQQVGEDKLESTIEFTETGGISANGLPLR